MAIVSRNSWHYKLITGGLISNFGSTYDDEILDMTDCKYVWGVIFNILCLLSVGFLLLLLLIVGGFGVITFLASTYLLITNPYAFGVQTTVDAVLCVSIFTVMWIAAGAMIASILNSIDAVRYSKYNIRFYPLEKLNGMVGKERYKHKVKDKPESIFVQRLRSYKNKVCTRVELVD